MASLTLKNLSEDLLQALQAAAERNRRSLIQEIIHLLETGLRVRSENVERPDVQAQVAAWRKLAGKWESDFNASAESRDTLDERTPGREVDL